MVPALVRFYGGAPAQWISSTWDEGLQFWQAISRLRAAESGIPGIPDLAKDFNFDEVLEKLGRDAAAQHTAAAPRSSSAPKKDASAAEIKRTMGAMGIRVEAA